jgi:methylenetetrahydrofolate dehydrogenase (NADP+)/methenyltetrahydrofolate cyclohydrolase
MTIIDGKAMAASVIDTVTRDTARLSAEHRITPGLSVVIVGDDPASQVYVASKERRAKECGFHARTHKLPTTVGEDTLVELVETLNADLAVHGILVQLPLPDHINERRVTQKVDPAKDVDGFNFINIGMLTAGYAEDALVPCTPAGVMVMIATILGEDLSGKTALVIGRSNIVGKPVASLLLHANATVTTAHSRTPDLPGLCRQADIVVAAVGRPQMVKGDWIKPGAVVIDVGMNRIPAPERGEGKTRLVGDVYFDEVNKIARATTPVPGGVGPMTIAMLMAGTLRAAQRQAGIKES